MRVRHKGEVHGGALTAFLICMTIFSFIVTVTFYIKERFAGVAVFVGVTIMFCVIVFLIIWGQRWNYYKEYP